MKISSLAVLAVLALTLLLALVSCGGGEDNPFGLESELVVAADRPITMAFAPDGRLFYGEQLTGNIRIVTQDGTLLAEPFAQIDILTANEWGLTGLAVDPDFEDNHFVYAYYTQSVRADVPKIGKPVVVRFTERDNKGTQQEIIIGDLPESDPDHVGYNVNGRINFGADGFLYVSIGDYDSPSFLDPQDLTALAGKLLRVDKEDGSPAPDNPFIDDPEADPRVYAYGFREAFDFEFSPQGDRLYATDNTPVSCEELNLIREGANYGYPDIGDFPFADCSFGRQEKAIHLFAKENKQPGDFLSTVTVSGLSFVSAANYPALGDGLLVCESETKLMRRLSLGGTSQNQVVADDIVGEDCNMEVAVSPDGTVYYSNDQEVRRLVQTETPEPEEP